MTVQISGCIFVANGVLDIIFYLILKHGLKKEIQDGSAGDGKKEDKVTDADVAVKDAETPTQVLNLRRRLTLRQSNLVLKIQVLGRTDRSGKSRQIRKSRRIREEQASQKPEEEEILEEWKD